MGRLLEELSGGLMIAVGVGVLLCLTWIGVTFLVELLA